MAHMLHVIIDDSTVVTYRKDQPLSGIQRRSLDQVDLLMDQGIVLDGQNIADPDTPQRILYVANRLINAQLRENHAAVAAFSAWLARRAPTLQCVTAKLHSEGHDIQLTMDDARNDRDS